MRDLAFMVITLVGMMTLCAVGSSIVESVAAQYTSLSLSILRPLVPVSAGALVIGFVLSGASTLVFVVVSSPLLAYALYGEVGASIPIAVAGFVGSSLIAGAHRGSSCAGPAAGLAGWLCSLGYSLLVSGAVSQEIRRPDVDFRRLDHGDGDPGGDTGDRVGAEVHDEPTDG